MEGDLTLGGEHPEQYTDDVLQNCITETCVILLTNVTPIYSIKIKSSLPIKKQNRDKFQAWPDLLIFLKNQEKLKLYLKAHGV